MVGCCPVLCCDMSCTMVYVSVHFTEKHMSVVLLLQCTCMWCICSQYTADTHPPSPTSQGSS